MSGKNIFPKNIRKNKSTILTKNKLQRIAKNSCKLVSLSKIIVIVVVVVVVPDIPVSLQKFARKGKFNNTEVVLVVDFFFWQPLRGNSHLLQKQKQKSCVCQIICATSEILGNCKHTRRQLRAATVTALLERLHAIYSPVQQNWSP